MEAREVLERLKAGDISVEEAEGFFKRQPFEDMGYAKPDLHRQVRSSWILNEDFVLASPKWFLLKARQMNICLAFLRDYMSGTERLWEPEPQSSSLN